MTTRDDPARGAARTIPLPASSWLQLLKSRGPTHGPLDGRLGDSVAKNAEPVGDRGQPPNPWGPLAFYTDAGYELTVAAAQHRLRRELAATAWADAQLVEATESTSAPETSWWSRWQSRRTQRREGRPAWLDTLRQRYTGFTMTDIGQLPVPSLHINTSQVSWNALEALDHLESEASADLPLNLRVRLRQLFACTLSMNDLSWESTIQRVPMVICSVEEQGLLMRWMRAAPTRWPEACAGNLRSEALGIALQRALRQGTFATWLEAYQHATAMPQRGEPLVLMFPDPADPKGNDYEGSYRVMLGEALAALPPETVIPADVRRTLLLSPERRVREEVLRRLGNSGASAPPPDREPPAQPARAGLGRGR